MERLWAIFKRNTTLNTIKKIKINKTKSTSILQNKFIINLNIKKKKYKKSYITVIYNQKELKTIRHIFKISNLKLDAIILLINYLLKNR